MYRSNTPPPALPTICIIYRWQYRVNHILYESQSVSSRVTITQQHIITRYTIHSNTCKALNKISFRIRCRWFSCNNPTLWPEIRNLFTFLDAVVFRQTLAESVQTIYKHTSWKQEGQTNDFFFIKSLNL